MCYDPARLSPWFVAANLSLLFVYLAGDWLSLPWSIRLLTDLDAESTLPTWYNASLLLLAGVHFFVAANAGALSDPWTKRMLLVLGVACVFLSMDETAGVHEQITASLKRFEALPRFAGDHGMWIPLYVAAGSALVVIGWPLLKRIYSIDRSGTLFLSLGVLMFVLALIAEIVGYGDLRLPENRRTYRWLVAAEEGLEMFGSTFLFLGSGKIMKALYGPVVKQDR